MELKALVGAEPVACIRASAIALYSGVTCYQLTNIQHQPLRRCFPWHAEFPHTADYRAHEIYVEDGIYVHEVEDDRHGQEAEAP